MSEAGDSGALLAEIRAQLRDLAARVSRLEEQGQAEHVAAVEQENPPAMMVGVGQALPPARPVLSEDRLIAISAAVAAFLGERVRIRQIRLIRSNAWAQQGRVSVQASHWLHH